MRKSSRISEKAGPDKHEVRRRHGGNCPLRVVHPPTQETAAWVAEEYVTPDGNPSGDRSIMLR
jgi:hypothetical protein